MAAVERVLELVIYEVPDTAVVPGGSVVTVVKADVPAGARE